MEKTSRAMNKRDRTDENDAYNLLPPSLEKIIPPLYATENIEASIPGKISPYKNSSHILTVKQVL
jgi:hypothetical protein